MPNTLHLASTPGVGGAALWHPPRRLLIFPPVVHSHPPSNDRDTCRCTWRLSPRPRPGRLQGAGGTVIGGIFRRNTTLRTSSQRRPYAVDPYPDLDGIAVDIFGTVDPIFGRPRRPRVVRQEVEPLQIGILAFLRNTVHLTAKECEAFVMAEGYGASESQIAAALGISQQSVHERLAVARRRCRQWVELRRSPAQVAAA
jgi:predicted DNA-binding protein (UPF0251 family)